MKAPSGKHVAPRPNLSRRGEIYRQRAKDFALLAVVLFALCVCGCSTFNRDWRNAAQQPAPPNSIEGRWEGAWTSDVNGHTGKLRCLLSHESDSLYRAWFRATYWKVFRFGYAVTLEVQERQGTWLFSGEENLGKMAGGVYHYEGRATPTNFHLTYRSKYDHGVFEMRRPD